MKFRNIILSTIVLSSLCSCVSIPEGRYSTQYSDGKVIIQNIGGKCELLLDGGISSDLPDFIESEINNLNTRNCSSKFLIINSHGGLLSAAQKIGKLIRSNKFDTVVRYEKQCSSACGLIFIAGINRIIWKPNFLFTKEPRIGFHTPAIKSTNNCLNITQASKDARVRSVVTNVFKYAESMIGRDPALQFTTNMFDTDCKDMKNFSPEILMRQGIATRVGTLETN